MNLAVAVAASARHMEECSSSGGPHEQTEQASKAVLANNATTSVRAAAVKARMSGGI